MACPTAPPAGTCGAITACLCPLPPFRIGQRLGEKKAHGQMSGAFLDWALEAFSGYVAADELYEGPYCVLWIIHLDASFKYSRHTVVGPQGSLSYAAPIQNSLSCWLSLHSTLYDSREYQ